MFISALLAEPDPPSTRTPPTPPEPPPPTSPRWTDRQGQYLAFIFDYTKINGQPPAEVDIARFLSVTPPSVHRMVVDLVERGLLARTPGAPRSLRVLVPRTDLPQLE